MTGDGSRARVVARSVRPVWCAAARTPRTEDMEMVFNVVSKAAIHFLSLKKGDIVQVTLAPGKTGLEEFWQLSRANGAKPRSPVELTAADMEWLGLAAKASPPPSS
jgi:hypothetical protein